MSSTKVSQSLSNLGDALERLGEALSGPKKNDLAIDGTIQRFEFVIELFWKTFKRQLMNEGVETTSPRDVLMKAFEFKWFTNDKLWLDMLKDRNETSHVYDELVAKRIYKNIKRYFPEMKRAYALLRKKQKLKNS